LGGADCTVERFGGRKVPLTQDHFASLGRHAQVDQPLGEAAADVMGTGEFLAVTGPFVLLPRDDPRLYGLTSLSAAACAPLTPDITEDLGGTTVWRSR